MPSSPPRRVLLVDDDALVLRAIAATVQHLGARCDRVQSGESAIEAAAGAFYDLVLMDLQMPGVDGLAATRRILANARPGEQWRIVGLSGDADDVARTACVNAGMTGLLQKPMRVEQLRQLLADCDWLDGARR